MENAVDKTTKDEDRLFLLPIAATLKLRLG